MAGAGVVNGEVGVCREGLAGAIFAANGEVGVCDVCPTLDLGCGAARDVLDASLIFLTENSLEGELDQIQLVKVKETISLLVLVWF